MKKRMYKIVVFSTIFLCGWIRAEHYRVSYPWEADTALAAWAISRYLDVGAVFIGVSPEDIEIESPSRAISLPGALYRRDARLTAFEKVIENNELSNACTEKLRRVSRVLEMSSWSKSQYPDIELFEYELLAVVPDSPGDSGLLKAFEMIDHYCDPGSE